MPSSTAIAIADRHREVERGPGDPGQDEREDDLLGRVRGRRDRVRAEDRERLRLGQALADLLLVREGPPQQGALDPDAEGPQGRRRGARGGLGRQLARARCTGSRACGGARRGPACRPACARRSAAGRRSSGACPTGHTTAGSRAARAGPWRSSPPGPTRRRTRSAATSRRRSACRAASTTAAGMPSRGWPTLPGLSRTRRPSSVSREPAPGLMISSRPSSSTNAIGTCVCPCSPERGRHGRDARPGDRRRGDVLPGGVARAAVDERGSPRARAARAGPRARSGSRPRSRPASTPSPGGRRR